jgi:hypothetical protein
VAPASEKVLVARDQRLGVAELVALGFAQTIGTEKPGII